MKNEEIVIDLVTRETIPNRVPDARDKITFYEGVPVSLVTSCHSTLQVMLYLTRYAVGLAFTTGMETRIRIAEKLNISQQDVTAAIETLRNNGVLVTYKRDGLKMNVVNPSLIFSGTKQRRKAVRRAVASRSIFPPKEGLETKNIYIYNE